MQDSVSKCTSVCTRSINLAINTAFSKLWCKFFLCTCSFYCQPEIVWYCTFGRRNFARQSQQLMMTSIACSLCLINFFAINTYFKQGTVNLMPGNVNNIWLLLCVQAFCIQSVTLTTIVCILYKKTTFDWWGALTMFIILNKTLHQKHFYWNSFSVTLNFEIFYHGQLGFSIIWYYFYYI